MYTAQFDFKCSNRSKGDNYQCDTKTVGMRLVSLCFFRSNSTGFNSKNHKILAKHLFKFNVNIQPIIVEKAGCQRKVPNSAADGCTNLCYRLWTFLNKITLTSPIGGCLENVGSKLPQYTEIKDVWSTARRRTEWQVYRNVMCTHNDRLVSVLLLRHRSVNYRSTTVNHITTEDTDDDHGAIK